MNEAAEHVPGLEYADIVRVKTLHTRSWEDRVAHGSIRNDERHRYGDSSSHDDCDERSG